MISKLNKKAQFYIFVAIILCISAYGLIQTAPRPKLPITDFEFLTQNYINEAENTINQALYLKKDLYTELDLYTQNFIAYAKTKNTNFKVLYILKDNDKTHIINYLNKDAEITSINKTLASKEHYMTSSNTTLTITYGDEEYDYIFTDDTVEFKALMIR